VEFLFELLLQFILQIVGEALFELGLHALAEPFRRPANPWLAGLGYLLFGAIFGAISLWICPAYLVTAPALRWINLALTPLAAGGCMAGMGLWRVKRGQARLRMDRFSYGYLFALSLALVRFLWLA
jgi:hypothetical protein